MKKEGCVYDVGNVLSKKAPLMLLKFKISVCIHEVCVCMPASAKTAAAASL